MRHLPLRPWAFTKEVEVRGSFVSQGVSRQVSFSLNSNSLSNLDSLSTLSFSGSVPKLVLKDKQNLGTHSGAQY